MLDVEGIISKIDIYLYFSNPKKDDTVIYNNILETIGNTPVVRINNMAPVDMEMYVKVEAFNPMASVKDRLAVGIIEDAERKGTLKPGHSVALFIGWQDRLL